MIRKTTKPLCLITGTTGSGKNEVAARVAALLDGEVISLDSMKVYRGMDIGTAKPSPRQRAMAPHHLIDLLDPRSESMNLRRYMELADQTVAEIDARGKTIVAVGGTAMYLMGLVYGVDEGPPRDEAFRKRLRDEAQILGVPALHSRLVALDPDAAAKIDPNDLKRIERALEIIHGGGPLPSTVRNIWFTEPRYDLLMYVLTWPRDILRQRIEARVDEMFKEGWINEVQRLRDAGGLGLEALMALGYRDILTYLDGQLTEEEMVRLIKIKTWQFSRRQLTWMRKFSLARTLIAQSPADLLGFVEEITSEYRRRLTAAK